MARAQASGTAAPRRRNPSAAVSASSSASSAPSGPAHAAARASIASVHGSVAGSSPAPEPTSSAARPADTDSPPARATACPAVPPAPPSPAPSPQVGAPAPGRAGRATARLPAPPPPQRARTPGHRGGHRPAPRRPPPRAAPPRPRADPPRRDRRRRPAGASPAPRPPRPVRGDLGPPACPGRRHVDGRAPRPPDREPARRAGRPRHPRSAGRTGRSRPPGPAAPGEGHRRPAPARTPPPRGHRRRAPPPPAVVAGPACSRQRHPRVVALDGRRERLDPAAGIARRQPLALATEQAPDLGPVLSPAVGAQGLGQGAVASSSRPAAAWRSLRRGLADLLHEHPVEVLAEHLVVAVCVAAILDRDGEHAAAGELVQERAAAGRAPEPVAQAAGQPAQDAGVHEEPAELHRQPDHHVLGEVLAQQPAAAPGAAQHPAALLGGPAARGQVEQLEPCRPAFGAPCEHREVRRGHGVVVDVAEELLHLPGAEAQVVRADLQQLPETRRRDRLRPGATRVARTSASHVGAQSMRRPNAASAAVSSSAWKSSITSSTGSDPARDARVRGRVLHGRPAARQARDRRHQRGLEVADERGLVASQRLRPVPGDGRAGGRGEACDERGLAGARRCDDQRQAPARRPRPAVPRGVRAAGRRSRGTRTFAGTTSGTRGPSIDLARLGRSPPGPVSTVPQ